MGLHTTRNMYGKLEVWEETSLVEVFCHHLLSAKSGGYSQNAYDGCIECLEQAEGYVPAEQRQKLWNNWRKHLDALDVADPMVDALNACKEIAAEIALKGTTILSRCVYIGSSVTFQ